MPSTDTPCGAAPGGAERASHKYISTDVRNCQEGSSCKALVDQLSADVPARQGRPSPCNLPLTGWCGCASLRQVLARRREAASSLRGGPEGRGREPPRLEASRSPEPPAGAAGRGGRRGEGCDKKQVENGATQPERAGGPDRKRGSNKAETRSQVAEGHSRPPCPWGPRRQPATDHRAEGAGGRPGRAAPRPPDAGGQPPTDSAAGVGAAIGGPIGAPIAMKSQAPGGPGCANTEMGVGEALAHPHQGGHAPRSPLGG